MRSSRLLSRSISCLLVAGSTVLLSGQTKQANDCGGVTLATTATLTFKQRSCLFSQDLLSPKFALTAGFAAVFGQLRNSPRMRSEDFDDVSRRFGVFYARHASQHAAELLVGYRHHEDPRFRSSDAKSFWRRTNSAFLNVVASPGTDGSLRVAYAPIAGALSSAFVGSALYRHSETLPGVFAHASAIYGYYFLRDFVAEFKPELNAYARHLLGRDR